jgi:uncharacterized membrane protein
MKPEQAGERAHGSYNQVAGTSLERLAALSDGLFAIAMTLIVLEIHVPPLEAVHGERDLWRALADLSPRMITYLLSFLTLGIFWVGQQTQLNHFRRANRHLTWFQLAFLAGIATMPFSTELLAEFFTYRTALLLYWANVLLLGLVLLASWHYARGAGLVKEGTPPEVSEAIARRIVVAQLWYACGAALCVINTRWSIGFIVLVQLNYAIAPRIPLLSRLTA